MLYLRGRSQYVRRGMLKSLSVLLVCGVRARGAAPYCTKCTVWGVVSLTEEFRGFRRQVAVKRSFTLLHNVERLNMTAAIRFGYSLFSCFFRGMP